ncbi:hypothetical protein [Pseudoruegeria sp. SK021]|uniref:hypothetical protein n=1 Tax=Pseudoruegeria sp. SK021 TaxID=1933035 RepID=UPI000A21FFE3|nr:hypothetical protein [Pseudoruegeria sp. SK021]OSP54443.1 hypothetical protein BV911_12645 [Pseudoruegeria sp. SK021]
MTKHVLDKSDTSKSNGLIEASVRETLAHQPNAATLALQQRSPSRQEGSRMREFVRIEASEPE